MLFFPLRPVLYSYRGGCAENRVGGGGSMDQHTVVHVPADAKVCLLNISVYIQSMFSVQVSLN